MTASQFSQVSAYRAGTVLHDDSGTTWVKKFWLWQRPGSMGDYDATAIVFPVEVLWEP